MTDRNNFTATAKAPYILPDTINILPLDRLCSGRSQVRRAFDDYSVIRLADSIRRYGILQPLTVRSTGEMGVYGKIYEIISGERRFLAAKLLGMKVLPCIIVASDGYCGAELSVIEEIHREKLNMFEIASALSSAAQLYGFNHEQLAERFSVSCSFVANKLSLLRFTPAEREKIVKYGLTERHARALLRVSDSAQRLRIIEYVNRYSLNAVTTENYIDRLLSEDSRPHNSHRARRIVLKDIRIFYNSVDRAVSLLKAAGVDAGTYQTDYTDFSEITVRIPKQNNVSRETSADGTSA